jgi:phosphate uptake regulator
MFRRLIEAWMAKDPMREMYRSLISMVEEGKWMYETAWGCAVEGRVPPEVRSEIYRRDIEVNRTERSIRRRIVEHLSVQPGVDVPACLILMSVVKDAERVGDYCKNILEAADVEAKPVTECACYAEIEAVHADILGLFSKTAKGLAESDETLGHDVIVEERSIGARCESVIERFITDDLTGRVAVPWALLVRYLKRVSAHLGNLASSLVMPLHKLDYFDEDYLPKRAGTGAGEGAGTGDGGEGPGPPRRPPPARNL